MIETHLFLSSALSQNTRQLQTVILTAPSKRTEVNVSNSQDTSVRSTEEHQNVSFIASVFGVLNICSRKSAAVSSPLFLFQDSSATLLHSNTHDALTHIKTVFLSTSHITSAKRSITL